jgi:hypothetical protein
MGEDLFMEFLYGYFFNYFSILHQTHPNPRRDAMPRVFFFLRVSMLELP